MNKINAVAIAKVQKDKTNNIVRNPKIKHSWILVIVTLISYVSLLPQFYQVEINERYKHLTISILLLAMVSASFSTLFLYVNKLPYHTMSSMIYVLLLMTLLIYKSYQKLK